MKKTTETAPDGVTEESLSKTADDGANDFHANGFHALTPQEYADLHTDWGVLPNGDEPPADDATNGDEPPAAPYVQDAPKTVDVVNLTGNDLLEALYDAGYIYLREGVLVVNIFHQKAEQYVAVDCSNLVGVQLRRLKKFQAAAGPDKELKAELGKALKRSKGKTEAELWAIFKEQLTLMSSDTGDN